MICFKVRDSKALHKGRLRLTPGYTYLVMFDNRNCRLSSSNIKYEVNIEMSENKPRKRLNSRRFSQLSTCSKRTEMILLIKEIIGRESLQKRITIEEDRPSSQLSASLSTSGKVLRVGNSSFSNNINLPSPGFLVPRSSCSSVGTVEVKVQVHRSKSLVMEERVKSESLY